MSEECERDLADLTIRKGTPEDLTALLAFTGSGSEASRWPRNAWGELLQGDSETKNSCVLILGSGGHIYGWIAGTVVVATAELEFLLIHPRFRGRGYGKMLLSRFLAWVRQEGGEEVLLEVRDSNLAAQRLYLGAGFVVAGRRKRYYSQPDEDALCMRLDCRDGLAGSSHLPGPISC